MQPEWSRFLPQQPGGTLTYFVVCYVLFCLVVYCLFSTCPSHLLLLLLLYVSVWVSHFIFWLSSLRVFSFSFRLICCSVAFWSCLFFVFFSFRFWSFLISPRHYVIYVLFSRFDLIVYFVSLRSLCSLIAFHFHVCCCRAFFPFPCRSLSFSSVLSFAFYDCFMF